MKPIFTIHAGEYLVGSYIEETFKQFNVWIPSKDTGIDLLVTNPKSRKMVSIQVKFSKDFKATHIADSLQKSLKQCGWWTLNPTKIKDSLADYWVFVLRDFNHRESQFVIIEPNALLIKLKRLSHGEKTIHAYFWITQTHRCWETRGLGKKDEALIGKDSYENENRDFTEYLNNWEQIGKRLT